MRGAILMFSAGVFMSGLGGCPLVEAHGAGTVYVAPDGDDGWSGTLPATNQERTDGPFKTLGRAREAIRQIKKDAAANPTVLVRGGTCCLSGPLILAPDDSGTKDHPVRYAAYPGEKPILSGGRPVYGWHRAEGDLWTAQVGANESKAWSAQQLFVDCKRQIRARHPNFDPVHPTTGGYLFARTPANWPGGFGACVGSIHNPGDFLEYDVEIPADGQYWPSTHPDANVIRNNLVVDSIGMGTTKEGTILSPCYTWGIYLDGETSNTVVRDNIVVGNVRGGIFFNGGHKNVVENNIFANASQSQAEYSNYTQKATGNVFRRNIITWTAPEASLFGGWANDAAHLDSDYNLYWHNGLPVPDLAQVQRRGLDGHSTVCDPQFVDSSKEDYRLKPNSPVIGLDFQPIDTSRIGPKGFRE